MGKSFRVSAYVQTPRIADNPYLDLLKLSDETDLEILNRSMEIMVDQFHTELLPVATQLSARLVCMAASGRLYVKSDVILV